MEIHYLPYPHSILLSQTLYFESLRFARARVASPRCIIINLQVSSIYSIYSFTNIFHHLPKETKQKLTTVSKKQNELRKFQHLGVAHQTLYHVCSMTSTASTASGLCPLSPTSSAAESTSSLVKCTRIVCFLKGVTTTSNEAVFLEKMSNLPNKTQKDDKRSRETQQTLTPPQKTNRRNDSPGCSVPALLSTRRANPYPFDPRCHTMLRWRPEALPDG